MYNTMGPVVEKILATTNVYIFIRQGQVLDHLPLFVYLFLILLSVHKSLRRDWSDSWHRNSLQNKTRIWRQCSLLHLSACFLSIRHPPLAASSEAVGPRTMPMALAITLLLGAVWLGMASISRQSWRT